MGCDQKEKTRSSVDVVFFIRCADIVPGACGWTPIGDSCDLSPTYPATAAVCYPANAPRTAADMTHEELTTRVQVLEERLARLAGALIVLLESIDEGNEKVAARAIRELISADLDA